MSRTSQHPPPPPDATPGDLVLERTFTWSDLPANRASADFDSKRNYIIEMDPQAQSSGLRASPLPERRQAEDPVQL